MPATFAERTMWDRMIVALAVSLAVHFVVVLVVQGTPPGADGTNAGVLTARLEPAQRVRPDVAPVEAVEEPPMLPARDGSAAVETASSEPVTATTTRAPQAAVQAQVTALDVPVIRDPTYHAARFLDEYPQPLAPIEPRYPVHASLGNISGSVTLLLLIDENGVLNDISVVEAQPPSIFNEAAIAAFRDMRFSPARKDGRAVRSRVLVTVGFDSNNPSSAR